MLTVEEKLKEYGMVAAEIRKKMERDKNKYIECIVEVEERVVDTGNTKALYVRKIGTVSKRHYLLTVVRDNKEISYIQLRTIKKTGAMF